MDAALPPLTASTLYLVATPIGNLEDITLHALRVLRECDVVAAEDTRHSGQLLKHFGISKPLLSYFQFNEAKRSEEIIERLDRGEGVIVFPEGTRTPDGTMKEFMAGIALLIRRAKVPVIVDAGVGTASDAAVAMELGCDGVLMNTAIAEAKDPIAMARAMRLAVEGGRLAYTAGRMGRRMYADPSSPLAGLI